jgi:hypothetical protein
MSRESRLLVILLVIGGVGVSGLMVVADQYRKALSANAGPGTADAEDASARAGRLVDGFLAARAAAKAVVARYPVEIEQLKADATSVYRAERLNAIAAHRMSYEDYATVRAAWRAFRAGKATSNPALLAAFHARRSALEDAALGPIEAVDDAIK